MSYLRFTIMGILILLIMPFFLLGVLWEFISSGFSAGQAAMRDTVIDILRWRKKRG